MEHGGGLSMHLVDACMASVQLDIRGRRDMKDASGSKLSFLGIVSIRLVYSDQQYVPSYP